jgi:excisionase family DNA binding protein
VTIEKEGPGRRQPAGSRRAGLGSPASPSNVTGLLTYEEAAAWLGTSPRHVRHLWATRQLAAVKVGRLIRFDLADLLRFAERNRVEAV